MSFSNMLEILKEKNKNKIILIRLGLFYIATGSDALFLSKELGLKCVCFKKEVCKIGIPEIRIEYYLKKLEQRKIGYIVYHFNDKKEELKEKFIFDGNYHKETRNNKNCLICKEIRAYSEDKYMNAIQKLLEQGSKNE